MTEVYSGGRPPSQVRTLIVDDERLARSGLRQMLSSDPDVLVVGECASGAEAIRALREQAVDLVLLDVQMRGMDGFEVIETIGASLMPVVIFTTAFGAHALRAFDACALDYVLKPIDEHRLEQAVNRAKREVAQRRVGAVTAQLHTMLDAVRQRTTTEAVTRPSAPAPLGAQVAQHRIELRSGQSSYYIALNDIDYIDADDYYSRIWVNRRQHLLREPLHALAKLLDGSRFFRVHRSAIVNLARVREVRSVSVARYIVVLLDGTRVPLSRKLRSALQRALERAP